MCDNTECLMCEVEDVEWEHHLQQALDLLQPDTRRHTYQHNPRRLTNN